MIQRDYYQWITKVILAPKLLKIRKLQIYKFKLLKTEIKIYQFLIKAEEIAEKLKLMINHQ